MSKRKKLSARARLQRALNSLNERDARYPNIPRSGYELKQQEAYVKKHPGSMDFTTGNVSRKLNQMISYAEKQTEKRRQQLIAAAAKVGSNG